MRKKANAQRPTRMDIMLVLMLVIVSSALNHECRV
jgi:hypothetical protein